MTTRFFIMVTEDSGPPHMAAEGLGHVLCADPRSQAPVAIVRG
jgi:hypothetical protein